MANLETRHADGGWFGFLQQHGYVPKVLRTRAMTVCESCACICKYAEDVMGEGQIRAVVNLWYHVYMRE